MQEGFAWLQQQGSWLWSELKILGSTLWKQHQTLLIQIIIGLILLYFVVKIVKKTIFNWKNREKQVFFRKERIFTRNELRFFKALQQAVKEKDLCIFPMLRVSELLRVKKQSNRKKYYKYFNQISRKHIDFTLCRQDNNEIVCCIELQDRTQTKNTKKKRDQFISELFSRTGIVLIHVKSSTEAYNVEAIQEQIEKAMEQNQVYLAQMREEKQKVEAKKRERLQKNQPKKKKSSKTKKASPAVERNQAKATEKKEEKPL